MKTLTPQQNAAFLAYVIDHNLLEETIAWIGEHMNPEDVFSPDQLEAWARYTRVVT